MDHGNRPAVPGRLDAVSVPGPQMKGVTDDGSADFHYGNWVDQHDTFGLGKNVPIANGSTSDSLLALLPGGKWVILRVPYPLGFYTRGLDGRIDNPNGGLEGTRTMGRLRHQCRLAHRRRERRAKFPGPFPTEARSAGKLDRQGTNEEMRRSRISRLVPASGCS